MVQGSRRSRTLRRVHVRTPGGKTVLRFKRRSPKSAKCGRCGAVLPGIPRKIPLRMKNLPKTRKKTARPYGGNLCSKCTRLVLIEKARSEEQ
ncbi:50S ribosomal protein L34e [Candidatus Woesearchaeota archaeon]|nr:50S ribosomal protein L34e [Candidatus Woesearchaeota archaeon]MBW3018029.1 50S ribosomal protein L34e [Candidatus Woesearchaeota archaeon]